jgi:two-component system, cell cycle sensor histidine kinase and response regulator CckA
MPRSRTMAAHDAHPHAAGLEVTVLVVDDERAVRSVVHRSLRVQGYVVIEAADAAAALAELGVSAGRIRVLITDDRMPGMSGRELARIVARVYPAIRVILMSGDPASGDPAPGAEGSESGVVLLPKPFTSQTLAATLRSTLAEAPGRPRLSDDQ